MATGPIQRRRGLTVVIYRSKDVIDSRGNKVKVVDEQDPHVVRAWLKPQRSARAELPGQQVIDIIRFGTKADLSDVDIWSQVEYEGERYDIVMPPAYYHGTRHTRHWSFDCRKRPS